MLINARSIDGCADFSFYDIVRGLRIIPEQIKSKDPISKAVLAVSLAAEGKFMSFSPLFHQLFGSKLYCSSPWACDEKVQSWMDCVLRIISEKMHGVENSFLYTLGALDVRFHRTQMLQLDPKSELGRWIHSGGDPRYFFNVVNDKLYHSLNICLGMGHTTVVPMDFWLTIINQVQNHVLKQLIGRKNLFINADTQSFLSTLVRGTKQSPPLEQVLNTLAHISNHVIMGLNVITHFRNRDVHGNVNVEILKNLLAKVSGWKLIKINGVYAKESSTSVNTDMKYYYLEKKAS